MTRKRFLALWRDIFCVICCLLVQPWCLLLPVQAKNSISQEAAQAADILGIRREVEQLVAVRQGPLGMESEKLHANQYSAQILRKILQAVLQVQAAENRLETELSYTYDVMSREQRKISNVNQFFNIFNFLQFGTLYTIEPYSRIHKQFKQSAICTSVGAGLGIGLPLICIFYNKFVKASNLAPPAFLSHVIDGKPVNGENLPPFVASYLDLPEPGGNISRRQALNSLWKERYHADMQKPETLCGIADGKSKNSFVLNTRIVLLWSLYTTIQGFDRELLALLNEVRDCPALVEEQSPNSRITTVTGLTGGASEAVRLLRIEPLIAELHSAGAQAGENEDKNAVKLSLLEALLAGYLDMRIAQDKCQEELNYQYDVVLAQMMARRGKFLQKTYEANFIQTGVLGACAGWSYLNGYPKAGNELFIIADSIGLGINTVSFLATHGGWRKNQSEPNSLADFFNLRANEKHGFSPLVWNFLNSSSPERKDIKSRCQYLQEEWKKNSVVNIDIKEQRNLEKLGSMPSCKWDTIKLVLNRIALLSDLREQLGTFDGELLALLRETWPEKSSSIESVEAKAVPSCLADRPSACAAARLLGVQGLVSKVGNGEVSDSNRLAITKEVMEGFLETSVDTNAIGQQIITESQVMNRMVRQRDMAIQMTNIANFYQIGILGCIADSLGLSSNSQYVLVGDRINIISGLMVSSLALAALAERRGGVRPGHAQPNAIGNVFKRPESVGLSGLSVRYLNSISPISPTQLTRRDELIKYWKESKVLNVNVKRDSVVAKLSANAGAQHWWSESINLINNRVTMLYDLNSTIKTSNLGFDELLKAVD
jgi:hypothetical protein